MLHIVTVATHSEYYFQYLVESCKKCGKELDILGYGEEWKGFNWRLTLIINYLKKLPENDIVCFIDGYDVICCRNLNEMPSEFVKIKEQTGCKIITGSVVRKNNFLIQLFNHLYFEKCKNENINAGTYIGIVKDLLEILPKIYELDNRHNADDQQLMIKYCQKNDNIIIPDKENKLFLTIASQLNEIDQFIDIDENHIVSYNLNKPFFIHAPGYGYLDNVIKKLGYDIEENKIKNEIYNNYFSKKLLVNIIAFITYFLNYILLFVIIIIILFYLINNSKIKKFITPLHI